MLILDKWQKEVLATKGNILLCSGRQVGKSTIVAKKAGDTACLAKKSILIISATERQAQELFIKTLNYLQENHRELLQTGKSRPTRHIINLINGSVIRCLPTGLAGTGIRGFTIDLLIADEAAFIPELVWSAVTPMLLTTGGEIILVSTPHGRIGFFWRMYNDQSFHVFHIKSEEVIKNREISVSWTLHQRKKAVEHLEREKRTMSALEYAQEYAGEFIDELRQFFPDEIIQRCMTRKREPVMPKSNYFLGVDVARYGGDEITFEIIDRTDRERLLHIESIVQKRKFLNETYNKIVEMDLIYKFKAIYIDDGGIGVGIFDFLLEKLGNKVIAINNRARPLDRDEEHKKKLLKEDLYNNLLGLMERGQIELLDDDEVFQSLKSVQYEYITKENALTKLRIFGNYTHIAEGLIRAAFCVKDKHLNIWAR